jgi:hypothetical protein
MYGSRWIPSSCWCHTFLIVNTFRRCHISELVQCAAHYFSLLIKCSGGLTAGLRLASLLQTGRLMELSSSPEEALWCFQEACGLVRQQGHAHSCDM